MSATIEISTDRGAHWIASDANIIPAAGVWIRFGGGDILDAIYNLICSGILSPKTISEKLGLPQWCVEDLLTPDDDEENTEDYGRLLAEYKAARRCSAWLKNNDMVLDLGAEDDLAERCS